MSKENNNKSTTKNNKKLYAILIFIVIVLIACISVEAYIYVKNSNRADSVNNLQYVGILEDGTYYISKAPKNIRFQINSNDTNSYTLKDEKENIIETRIINKNGKNFIEAANEYNEGKTYYLELINTNFSEERFKDAKKVKFKIQEQEKANYTLSDKVKFIASDMEIQDQNGVKILVLNNNEYSPNDILIKGTNTEFNDAYKITEIKDGIAYLTAPEVSEIYEDIDLYKEYKVNFQNVEINEEFKDQIKVGVKKSALYQFLVNESYAADNTDVDIQVDKGDNNIKIGIKITVPASGRAFLGIKALANHDVNFEFTIDLTSDVVSDMKKNEDMALDVCITEKIDFGITLTAKENVAQKTEELSKEDYEKVIGEIIKQLDTSNMDTTEGDPRITGMKYNLGIPGIDVYFDIYFPVSWSMQIDLSYKQQLEFKQNMGIIMNDNGETTPYSTIAMTSSTSDFSVIGKANLKAGLCVDIGISFISKDFAHLGISDEVGLYGDAFIATKMNYNSLNKNVNTDFAGKIEFGIYNKAQVNAGINIFFVKQDYNKVLEESKNPLVQFGNDEIVTGISPTVKQLVLNDGKITVPTIVKNIKSISLNKTRQEQCNAEFTDKNGNPLNVNNGIITIGENIDTTIIAVYKEGRNVYKVEIPVKKQGTIIIDNSNENTVSGTNNNPNIANQNIGETNNNGNLTINEIAEQMNFALKNAMQETVEYDKDIYVTNFQERLDKRYKILGAYNTLDSDFDHRKYIEPNTQLTYKQKYKSLVSDVDWLYVYDTKINREFRVRVFRTATPPLAYCGSDSEVFK